MKEIKREQWMGALRKAHIFYRVVRQRLGRGGPWSYLGVEVRQMQKVPLNAKYKLRGFCKARLKYEKDFENHQDLNCFDALIIGIQHSVTKSLLWSELPLTKITLPPATMEVKMGPFKICSLYNTVTHCPCLCCLLAKVIRCQCFHGIGIDVLLAFSGSFFLIQISGFWSKSMGLFFWECLEPIDVMG